MSVYFIMTADLPHYVKIGYTKSKPQKRLRALQTGNPSELQLECVVEGDISLEQRLHKTFLPLMVRGEWFRFDGKLNELMSVYLGYGSERIPYDEFIANANAIISAGKSEVWEDEIDIWLSSADQLAWFGSRHLQ